MNAKRRRYDVRLYCGNSSIIKVLADGTVMEVFPDGTKVWKRDGKLHRKNGPAVEWWHGTKEWWYNGLRHRVGGPAIVWADGSKEYWYKGMLHREDGPAIDWVDSIIDSSREGVEDSKQYWRNGKRYYEDSLIVKLVRYIKRWWRNKKQFRR